MTTTFTRNRALRLLALLLTTLFASGAIGDPDVGYGSLFIVWALATVLLGNLFVALWGNGRQGYRYPSGGDL
jgi:hypothetical protein